LTAVPESIGQLASLTLLELSYNQLAEVPDSIRQLAGLTTFNVEGNPHLPGPRPR